MLHYIKKDPLLRVLSDTFFILAVPMNITFFWNFGSLLFFFLANQIFTGLWLAYFYFPDVNSSFDNIFISIEFIDFN